MAGIDFRLPGFKQSLKSPEAYVSGLLRASGEASQALGRALDLLVVRLAEPHRGAAPDYQIQTLDGEDAAAFSGETHTFLDEDDITVRIEETDLQDQSFNIEQVKDWLNEINGEGRGGGDVNPILRTDWGESDVSDPRDDPRDS